MRANLNLNPLTRRQFLHQGTAAAGFLGLALVSSSNETSAGSAAAGANPFAYDVGRFSKTDPKLIRYTEIRRFPVSREEPRRIAVGPDDQLYIGAGKYVTVLDRGGVQQAEAALRETVRCLAAAPDGDMFVGLRDHVEVFDRKGQRRATWDSPGPRTWLTGIAISKGSVFLADAGNRIVLHCDLAGKVLARLGGKNKLRNTPGFIVPSPFFDLELHPDGLLRVTNPGRHRVEAYTTDGDLEMVWGRPSAAIDGFCGCCNPINITLLPDGRVVTCEKGLPRVKVYQADGTFDAVVAGVESFPDNAKIGTAQPPAGGPYGGLDVAADSLGQIYILDVVKGDVRLMAPKADVPKALLEPSAAAG